MEDTPEQALDNLIALLAKQAAKEYLENPNYYLENEIPPLPEELHNRPKPIARDPSGNVLLRLK
ncbi:hypothetical protein ACTPOE_05605 [Castellaniella sp. WN]